MRSGSIQVSQITASSQWDSNHGPNNARLFFTARNGRGGAWCTRPNNLNQWLQVDFKGQTVVVGISTQGREDCCSQWVKTYMLYYSINGVSFFPYKNLGQVKVGSTVDLRSGFYLCIPIINSTYSCVKGSFQFEFTNATGYTILYI